MYYEILDPSEIACYRVYYNGSTGYSQETRQRIFLCYVVLCCVMLRYIIGSGCVWEDKGGALRPESERE